MVTASNGFLQLFSLDKNYFSYSMVVEQLKTEGWQFFGLSGKYEDYESHQEAYKVFSKSIESIKRKQVEQEFSNGKGDNKKKKFDFHGEMKKFSQDQQRSIENVDKVVDTVNKIQNVTKAVDKFKEGPKENVEMEVIEEGEVDAQEKKEDEKEEKKEDEKKK